MPRVTSVLTATFVAASVLSFHLVAGGATASADHFFGATGAANCTNGNMPDDGSQFYFYDDATAASINAAEGNRVDNINPTDMGTARVNQYSSGVDVVVLDQYYSDYCGVDWFRGPNDPDGVGVVGQARCFRLVSGGARCDQHDLRFNLWFTDETSNENRRGLACHEGGHTTGLDHRPLPPGTNGCMHQGYPKVTTTYDSHDRLMLNSNY